MKKIPIWYIVIIIIYVLSCLLLSIPSQLRDSKLPEKRYGMPVVIKEYYSFDENRIEQIVDDGTYLYVLADKSNGYVQVYDFQGTYQHTLSFAVSSASGTFRMYTSFDYLYVLDGISNVYQFKNGEFIGFSRATESKIAGQISSMENSSSEFIIKNGSIWRNSQSGSHCVVQRSCYAICNQYRINDIVFWLVMLGSAFALIGKDKRQKTGDGLREP